ncbi:ShlB/FhaC/HecB family hemolysin secretion/activation protein [Pseudomonas sp. RC10]|uniref:ShlB/FhaC/HecB family hemolysin secretion/activation protein n=1 Tax=Pseudomonas bambusae TaxID=3139142 RepID=UPI003138C335
MRTGLVIAGLGLISTAYAAPGANPGDRSVITDRQERLLEDQRRKLEQLQHLQTPTITPTRQSKPTSSACFPIRRITLKGAAHLSVADQRRLVEPFHNQCLGAAQLDGLLRGVTNHYLNKGWVTSRAYLPEQDLSGGTLTVQVVEGQLEALGAEQGAFTAQELRMGFPGQAGEILDLRTLEQLVDQLNRLPSNRARLELKPGKQVGGSDVRVLNEPLKPWRAQLSRSNAGQKSTGEQQWDLGLEWDNPLGLADRLNLRSGADAVSDHQRHSESSMLYYELPYQWWNVSYAQSRSHYRSCVQANDFAFAQTGDTVSHQVHAERVLHRDGVGKTSLQLGVSHLRSNSYIEGSRLLGSSHRLSELQVGLSHGRRIGSVFTNLSLGMQKGVGAFGAQRTTPNNPARPDDRQPQSRYRKYGATLSVLAPFQLAGEAFMFSSMATGQYSQDVLFSPQRMSLGGESSVRGYKEQFLSGDSGGYWRNDLRWTRPVNVDWLRPVVSGYGINLGYDRGVIRHHGFDGGQHGRLSGHSTELFAGGEHASLSLTFAHSLERPDALAERETPVYLRLKLFL